ncbi:MAG TPA: tetratricopeptide repeat protein [Longimicrobiales bacterium]|nr:tetratricopeptide repeat protein [Longimicrobiales bacterium]
MRSPLNPNSFTAHDNLAFVLFDLHRMSEALAHWEAALAIRPDEPDALAGKAIALQSLNRGAEAVLFYQRAVAANPTYLDCEALGREFFWSRIACNAAAPLIRQVR